MNGTMTWVGMDVHARSTHAAAIDSLSGELRRARFGPGTEEVVGWLGELEAPVRAAYEAGPTGFGLMRVASAAGIEVQVVAPSKTPRAPGDRVKTDRKDAELLARLLLAGQLKAVTVPPEWLEAIRHLARTREQVRRDLMRARHRVSKLLLVHGRVYPGKSAWGRDHRRWLSQQAFEHEATELAFIDQLAAVDGLCARREALDERLSRLAQDERLWPTVARLRAFRGIDTLTALMLHLELGGDWGRFSSPRKLSSWLGLTPSLQQSGESESQGAITKTGSGIARRLLVESAHHYAREPRIGATLANRQAGQPDHVLQIAWRAQTRLHRVGKRLRERGKPGNVATVAVARELAGFLWAARRPRHELTANTAVALGHLGPGQRPPARAMSLWAALTRLCPFLDCARRRRSQRPGIANSRIVRLTAVDLAPGPGHRALPHRPLFAVAISAGHLTKRRSYQGRIRISGFEG